MRDHPRELRRTMNFDCYPYLASDDSEYRHPENTTHGEALNQGNDAFYPFAKSHVKTYSVPKGQFAFSVDDLLRGRVPQRLIVGLASPSAFSGKYNNNPFNFCTFDYNKVGIYVEGKSVPSQPLQPKFSRALYTEAYDMLKKNKGRAVNIS